MMHDVAHKVEYIYQHTPTVREVRSNKGTLFTVMDSATEPYADSTPHVGEVGVEEQPSRMSSFLREASCHCSLVIAGWSDASSGPLIPYIQAYYGISYTVVSMLFVGQMVGFLSAGFCNSYFTQKFGLGKVITIGSVIQACGYVFLIPAFPFPVMPCCYAVIGFGMALQDAAANVYVATLPNADHKFGLLHASYGLGALVCPLAATAFASSGIRFSFFYGISITLAILNIVVLLWAFKFNFWVFDDGSTASKNIYKKNKRLKNGGHKAAERPVGEERAGQDEEIELDNFSARQMVLDSPFRRDATGDEEDIKESRTLDGMPPESSQPASTLGQSGRASLIGDSAGENGETSGLVVNQKGGRLRRTLTNRVMWNCCIFILFYVGSEVSMGGWIVTFVIDERNGGASAGYIATGFWAGITLGRALLPRVNTYVGEKKVIFYYLFIATGLEFAIWYGKNLIGGAVAVAFVGFFIGPIYPIVMSVSTKLLPRSLHSSGIGFIAAFGQTGSAIFPFTTGALAQRYNPAVLQPVMIVLFSVQVLIWWWVPDPDADRKVE